MRAALPLADVLEHEWQSQVVELARTLGWTRIYHTFNSRRSAHGFPDLVLIRDRVLFIEVKREKTKLTVHQKEWIRALQSAGADAYVVRPRDLESLAAVLAARIPPPTVLGRCAAADELRAASWEESA
jgi:hypothetical protein